MTFLSSGSGNLVYIVGRDPVGRLILVRARPPTAPPRRNGQAGGPALSGRMAGR